MAVKASNCNRGSTFGYQLMVKNAATFSPFPTNFLLFVIKNTRPAESPLLLGRIVGSQFAFGLVSQVYIGDSIEVKR
eukprot:scaffold6785_cov108-Cylindrotheca_fusiformis.AAC.1